MKRPGEEGYILAGALAALFAMSVVAAVLVAATVQEMRRVADVERAAADDAALDGAITLAAAELVREPQARALTLDGPGTVSVAGRIITVTAGWESEKLDLNGASPEAVDAALAAVGLDAADRASIRQRLQARNETRPISLIDDLLSGVPAPECARAILTTFGGRSDWTNGDRRETIPLGFPAPGSRIWISAALNEGDTGRGREAVFLVTGDPVSPVRVLDWRSTRGPGGEACDAG